MDLVVINMIIKGIKLLMLAMVLNKAISSDSGKDAKKKIFQFYCQMSSESDRKN